MRVGESRKRGVSFVNGQFGFGMQAFRAACSSLTVRSRHETADFGKLVNEANNDVYQIHIDRAQSDGFALESLNGDDLDGTAFDESAAGVGAGLLRTGSLAAHTGKMFSMMRIPNLCGMIEPRRGDVRDDGPNADMAPNTDMSQRPRPPPRPNRRTQPQPSPLQAVGLAHSHPYRRH